MLVKVKVHGVVLDPVNRGFAVILTDEGNKRWLPIYVGPFEAQAIAMEMEHASSPRPLTHDLMKTIIDSFGMKIAKVTVTELKENTFFANITLEHHNDTKEIDSRPSDAIALALRCKAPILVEEQILEKAGLESMPQEDEKAKKIKQLQLKLQEAIESENYEEAAKIRDEIKKSDKKSPEVSKKLKLLQDKLNEALKKEDLNEVSKIQSKIKKLKDTPPSSQEPS